MSPEGAILVECVVEGCTKDTLAKGLCPMHYRRLRVHGDVGGAEAFRPKVKGLTCRVDGCAKAEATAGLCPMHYQRQRIHGDVGPAEPTRAKVKGKECEVEGCGQPRRKRTWCAAHYSQWRRTGEVRPFQHKWSTAEVCRACAGRIGDERSGDFCSLRCRALWKKHDGVIPWTMVCGACGETVPLQRIDGSRKRSDSGFCDPCLAKGERTRSYRQRNAEALAAGKSQWKKDNREHVNRNARRRNRERPELAAEAQRRYLASHPEVSTERSHRRRSRLLGAFVEDVSRSLVWERDGGVCGICGTPADPSRWHLDHVIPLARGGEHSMVNVQVSHPSCNVRKGSRLPSEMAEMAD